MSTGDEHAGWSADSMMAAGEQADEERWNHANLSALGGIQQALLAIHAELRQLNEGRDEFCREVGGTLRAFRETEG